MLGLEIRLFDTHAHLDDSIYERDLDIVIRHAQDAGVGVVTVGTVRVRSGVPVFRFSRYSCLMPLAAGLRLDYVW